MDDEFFCGSAMSNNSKRSKRQLSDDETDTNIPTPNSKQNTFPKFIIVQASDKENPITKLSPFVIEKQISSILGTPTSIKNLRNGSLLVEVNKKQQADNLLKTTSFFNRKVDVYAHPTLNSSRGVVRCREISDTPLDEVKEEMKKEGVTDIKRIKIKKNGKEIQTNTYIFTFDTPVLPTKIKIAYHSVRVEVYIPNPLQCFRCQKFGHHENTCKAQEAVCGRCAKTGHSFRTCTDEEIQCVNCHQNHQSNSRFCTFWKKEKEILRIKNTENVSFYDARLSFENRNKVIEINQSTSSYASISKPKTSECEQCKILVDKLCLLFPEKAKEIRHLVQPSKDVPVPSSTAVIPKTLEKNQSINQNVKKPEQNTKQIKSNDTPKQKISLPGKSISKTSTVDCDRSTEKKIKIKRCGAEGNDFALQPIPTSSNKYQALSDMEDDSEEEDSSEELPHTENT